MDLSILNNLNNISSNLEEVYSDYSDSPPDWFLDLNPQNKLDKRKKNKKKTNLWNKPNFNKSLIKLQLNSIIFASDACTTTKLNASLCSRSIKQVMCVIKQDVMAISAHILIFKPSLTLT